MPQKNGAHPAPKQRHANEAIGDAKKKEGYDRNQNRQIAKLATALLGHEKGDQKQNEDHAKNPFHRRVLLKVKRSI
jgi:hypothetical protein